MTDASGDSVAYTGPGYQASNPASIDCNRLDGKKGKWIQSHGARISFLHGVEALSEPAYPLTDCMNTNHKKESQVQSHGSRIPHCQRG